MAYVHGYDERANERLHDQAQTLLELLHADTTYPAGSRVLEAGCGVGAQTVTLGQRSPDARFVSIDVERASVDEAQARVRAAGLANVELHQADIFALPFRDKTFDLAYSIGVLHHTPDPRQAFAQLPRILRPGGKLSITVYDAGNKVYVANTRFWRRITTRLPRKVLHTLSYAAAPLYYVWTLPVLGNILRTAAFISLERDWRWRVLDTFDWYSPRYMSWHTHPEVFGWFKENGFVQIEVLAPSVSQIGVKSA
jgi:ubiquinone/menaquinone biosynthesis C-methylase UbiE